jgi:SAM-dependent methyltransferase
VPRSVRCPPRPRGAETDSLAAMAPVDDWREVLVVSAAYETGVLACLATPGTPDAVADELGLDRRAVRITVEALIDRGWATGGAGRVELSPAGVAAMRPDSTDQTIAEVLLSAREIAAYLQLPTTLATGAPSHDVSAGDVPTRQRFLAAMRAVSSRRAPATSSALAPPAGGGRLLDVGGGPGTYARAFTQAGWDVTVMDLPESLELGGADLALWGVRQISGDVTAGIPMGPWDCVYLGNITHLFGPELAAQLVARAGAALVPGGRLAIQEVVRGLAAPAALFGVAMLVGTRAGDVYDQATYAGWMAAAGCPLVEVVATEPERHHLLIGVRG